jgi:multicomponent Na+:H+ antiporter subunit C
MSSNVHLYALTGIALFSLGLYALIAYAHLVRKILAINVMSTGIALLLIATAQRMPGVEPDPVPHALVLTGIVVMVSATGFALALICRVHDETGEAVLPEEWSGEENSD